MEHFLNQIETYLQTSLLLAFAAAYLGGLLASLTPCVYPLIPVTAGVIGNSNLGGTRLRGFILSLCYVAGMAVTYAVLGVFAAATGRFFGAMNTNPWTMLVVGNIFLFFGLSMLGVCHMPSIGPKALSHLRGIPGVFLLGMASGLIASPCTAPVMGVLLTYVATTQNLFLGGSLLFVYAFGQGAILLAVGTFSGLIASIPVSGGWTERIKTVLGLFMVGLAEYFFIQAGKMFF